MPAGGPIKQIGWWLIVAMILLAVWRGIGANDVNSFFDFFKNLAGQTEETFTDVGEDIKKQIPTPDGSTKPTGDPQPSAEASASAKPEPSSGE